jgi:lipoyl(octanoyl) transferase
VRHAGVVDYPTALELQKQLVQAVRDGNRPNTILLLEHPHTYTIGRLGTKDQVLVNDAQLSELGVSLYEADRGGQVTYHGPGQLVGYPILDLQEWGGPLKYVRTLEQVLIHTLNDFGISAVLIDGLTGVWAHTPSDSAGTRQVNTVDNSWKIGAIGVKISRWVTYHGFSLNVSTDLSYYDHIIPCGIADGTVTSAERLLSRPVDMDEVAYSLVYHFGQHMGFQMVETDPVSSGNIQAFGQKQPLTRQPSALTHRSA